MRDDQSPIRQRVWNLSLAAVAAQAGCATLGIVFGALFLGLWLDNQFGQEGLCVFGVLVLSVPLSLFVMLRIALGAISLIQFPAENKEQLTSVELKEESPER